MNMPGHDSHKARPLVGGGAGRRARVFLFTVLILADGGAGAAASEMEPGIPILIDTAFERGLSDILTIVHAARTPGIGLVGVLISSDSPRADARTAAKILKLAGRPDVPVLPGVPSAAKSAIPRQWAADTKWTASTPLSVTEFLIDQSHLYYSSLFYLASGPLTNLAETIREDPGFPMRLAQLYLVAEPPGVDAVGGWTHDPGAAHAVLSSTIPITILDSRVREDSLLTRMRVLRIASARTLLSDSLTRLIALLTEAPGPVSDPLPATSYLPVGGASLGRPKSAHVRIADGRITEATEADARPVAWAAESSPSAGLKEAIRRVCDGRGELTMTLTRFVTDIANFEDAARVEIERRLEAGMPVVAAPEGMETENAFRFQLLAFMGGYLQMLSKLTDPLAAPWLERFKNAFAHEAGLGLRLPDLIYVRWRLEITPGQANPVRFGLSNRGSQLVSELRGRLHLGDWSAEDQIRASSSEARFEFETPAFPTDQPLPTTAEFSVSFRCLDLPFAFSASVPVAPSPRAEVSRIRQTTEGIEIRATTRWTSPHLSAKTLLSATLPGCADCPSASATIEAETGETVVALEALREGPAESGLVKVNLAEHTGGARVSEAFALLPGRGDPLLLDGSASLGSGTFAVRREETWGWSTDFLGGCGSLDYRVAPSGFPISASQPVWLEVDYFSEGDETDTFRIEAATESLEFQPVTAWMIKPEERGWRTDRFRASPMTEPLFQQGRVRWLRVRAGEDGDEIIRSLRALNHPSTPGAREHP
ncbi:MAG: hypothetical protein GHCLOJNM_04235 [bacterium]|nr:hypothetical protein [bacterium]